MEPFNANLKGAHAGEHKTFDVEYPADYPDPKLAGKKYHYAVEVLGIKTKKLPELNDEFAKDVSDAASLEELKKKVREGLEHQRDHKHKELLHGEGAGGNREAARLPGTRKRWWSIKWTCGWSAWCVSLAAQGVDPRAVNVDWVTLRKRQGRAREGRRESGADRRPHCDGGKHRRDRRRSHA